MADIPKIILDEQGHSVQIYSAVKPDDTSKNSPNAANDKGGDHTTTISVNRAKKTNTSRENSKESDDSHSAEYLAYPCCGHMPIRSSSDIGLPTTSMPNLALSLMAGGCGSSGAAGGPGDTPLGVYCSPRASRRSVDLEAIAAHQEGRVTGAGSKFHGYIWQQYRDVVDVLGNESVWESSAGMSVSARGCINTGGDNSSSKTNNSSISVCGDTTGRDSIAASGCSGIGHSNNSLRVLTSSSRAASALSLTSDCTARSIGLLSNDGDSDSEADVSLMSDTVPSSHEGQINPVKAAGSQAQLRRYLSHPEEAAAAPSCEITGGHGGHTRPSVSLINIKGVETSLIEGESVYDNIYNRREATTAESTSPSSQASVSSVAKPLATEMEKCIVSSNSSNEDTKHTTPSTDKPHAHTDPTDVRAEVLISSTVDGARCQNSSKGSRGKKNSSETSLVSTIPQSLRDGSLHKRTRRCDLAERSTLSSGGSKVVAGCERSGQRMLSYNCDPQDSLRNDRIRQWLQDMDKVDLTNG